MEVDDSNDTDGGGSTTSSERDDVECSRRTSYLMAYHTLALTGHAWVLELLTGHPDRIQCELGVRHHVFHLLIDKLRELGHSDSRYVTLEEQLAIFLYSCVTGLSTHHVGERFQRTTDTISRYFKAMLAVFSSALFYTTYV